MSYSIFIFQHCVYLFAVLFLIFHTYLLMSSFSFQLDDCALQIFRYRTGVSEYGNYLDLEATLAEQAEELEGFVDQ